MTTPPPPLGTLLLEGMLIRLITVCVIGLLSLTLPNRRESFSKHGFYVKSAFHGNQPSVVGASRFLF